MKEIISLFGDKLPPEHLVKLQELQTKLVTTELEIVNKVNIAEAQHPSIFVAGWRPAVGWICTIAVAFQVIIKPLIEYVFIIFGHNVTLPAMPIEQVYALLGALLGVSGLRTFDKIKGKGTSFLSKFFGGKK